MATGNVRNILRLRGRLCYGATNLTTDYPHGGTALGLVRDMIFNFGAKTTLSTAEEWGGVVSKAFYTGERPFLAAVLRDFDNDSLNAIFPNTTAGSSSGDRYVTYGPGASGVNRPGYDLTNKQIKLVFSPTAADRHPFIILYYAIPALEETAALNLSLSQEVGIGVAFWGGVDSSGRTYAIGKREDINGILA